MTESPEELPPLAEWQRKALELGLEQARHGEFASDEAVARVFGQWGVDDQDQQA